MQVMSIISQPQGFPPQKRKPIILNDLSQLSILKPLPPIFDNLANIGVSIKIRKAAYDCLNSRIK